MYKVTVDCATQQDVIDLLVSHEQAKKSRQGSHQQVGTQVVNGPATQQITHQHHQAPQPQTQQPQVLQGNPNVYGGGQPTHAPHTIASDRIALPLQPMNQPNGNGPQGYNPPQANPYGTQQEQHHFTPPAAQFHDPNAHQPQPNNGQPVYQQQPAQPGQYGQGNGASPGPNHAAPGGLTWADVAGLQKEIITSGRANAGAVFQIMQKYGGSLSGDPAPQHFAEIIREMKQLAGMA